MVLLSIIMDVLILCPFVFWGISYIILKKFSNKRKNIFSKAADLTTFILLFSIQASVKFIWSYDIGFIVLIIASIIAIVFTTIEWRTRKEIELMPLFRKIWRFLFLVLTFTYIAIWFVGLVLKIIELATR